MKSKLFLTLIGVTAAIVFSAQLGVLRPGLAAARAMTNPDHSLKVKHTRDNDDNVIWGIKENRKRAFHLPVNPNETIEWQNTDSKETNMSIIVNNSNDWQTVQGTFGPPTYGPGCAKCGQIDTQTGKIRLTFVGASNSTNYFYQIVVPDQGDKRALPYDYDMVDATVVWNQGLKKGQDKAPSK